MSSIFRCYVSFREGTKIINTPWNEDHLKIRTGWLYAETSETRWRKPTPCEPCGLYSLGNPQFLMRLVLWHNWKWEGPSKDINFNSERWSVRAFGCFWWIIVVHVFVACWSGLMFYDVVGPGWVCTVNLFQIRLAVFKQPCVQPVVMSLGYRDESTGGQPDLQ